MLEQAAREDEHVQVRRPSGRRLGLRDDERERAVGRRAAAAPAPVGRLPDLDHPVRHGYAFAVEQLATQDDRAGVAALDELVVVTAAETDRVERPHGLGRGPHEHQSSSSGVVPGPPRPSTMFQR